MEGRSWMDKLAVFFRPRISDCVDLRVSLEFFFGKAMEDCPPVYRGTNQMLTFIFDLDKLTRK
ncbi:MAG: hypothetical protein II019_07630 [Bacteroidales bacterium]|nr:hypothetical protein [Bacteroidales bacterium]